MNRRNLSCFVAACLFMVLLAYPAAGAPLAERETLPNGMVLLHAEKKSLPIVQVVVAVKAGSIAEPPEKAGLAHLTASLLNEGTRTRTSRDISDAIEFVGGSLGTSAGADYITVTLSVLKKDMELGFDLLSDVLRNPLFSEEEIARQKAIIKGSLIQQNEEPGIIASKAFAKAVFGEHPYGRRVEGTIESVDILQRRDIIEFHGSCYTPDNAVMSVVGDVSREELQSLIGKHFQTWEGKNRTVMRPEPPAPKDSPSVIKIHKDLSQATIVLGHRGISRNNPDYYAVSVMNYILGGGGFASRLMDNIRDNKGLAYDVHSFFSAHTYGGSFQAGLQTKNQSANTAIEEILREMEKMKTEPVSDRELEDAASYLTGSFPLKIDSNSKIASVLTSIELYGLGLDYVENYKKFIESVTKDDILRVAKRYLDTKNYVLVVVGDMGKAALKY